MIYLDNAATTKPTEGVVRAVLTGLEEHFANPSAVHRLGVEVRAGIERDREDLAAYCGVDPRGVLFTSGGTEANRWAVQGCQLRSGRERIVTSAAEHPSLREAIRDRCDARRTEVPLRPDGSLDLEALEATLDDSVALVALCEGHNEIGSRLPVEEVSRLVRKRTPRAFLHLDCVQSFGKPGPPPLAHADSVAISAHKVHGPKGIGALVLARPGRAPSTMMGGGGQEFGRRGGTENVPGIFGFAQAVRELAQAGSEAVDRSIRLRNLLEVGITEAIDGVRVLAVHTQRLPHVLSLIFDGVLAKVLLHHLELEGIFASAGAACQSRKKELSPALLALGLTESEIRSTVRFSTSRQTTEDELTRTIEVLQTLVPSLRRPMTAR